MQNQAQAMVAHQSCMKSFCAGTHELWHLGKIRTMLHMECALVHDSGALRQLTGALLGVSWQVAVAELEAEVVGPQTLARAVAAGQHKVVGQPVGI